jgi:hypothetical protein
MSPTLQHEVFKMLTRTEGEWIIFESDDRKIRIHIHNDTKVEFQKTHGKQTLEALIENEIDGAKQRREEIKKAENDIREDERKSNTLRSKLGV